MQRVKTIAILILCIFLLSATAAAKQDNSRVLTNEDLSKLRLQEIQSKKQFVEPCKVKTAQEKQLYKHQIKDLNEEIEIYANLDSSTIVCGKTKEGKIRLVDIDKKEHKLRSIKLKYGDIQQVPGFQDNLIKITHYNDAGLADAVWLQEVRNDNGWVYLEDLPFSEIEIGGFLGEYRKVGTLTYPVSQTFNLGSDFTSDNVNYIEVSIDPVYNKTGPYDIPTNGLVAWWRFDEGEGTLVQDFSGNGNHGTAENGMNWTEGKYNGAGLFDGDNDRVIIPNSASLSVENNSCTWVFILNSSGDTGSQIFYQHGGSGGSMSIRPYLTPVGGFNLDHTTQTGLKYWSIPDTSSINTTRMILIEYIRETPTLNVYIDNQLVGSRELDSALIQHTSYLYIGYSSGSFNGYIDNVMIYNRLLSAEEKALLYYDNLQNLRLKTNSDSTYSDYLNGSGTIQVPYENSGEAFNSLIANIPDEVEIDGITVRDYTKTVTPFNVTANVGYTENTTIIEETLTDTEYTIYVRYSPLNSYGSGTITYTADLNPILSSSLLQYSLESNNPAADLSYDSETYTFLIETGAVLEDQVYNFLITCTKDGTPIDRVISDGFGNSQLGVYEAIGSEAYMIGSLYPSRSSNYDWYLNGNWADVAGLAVMIPLVIVAVFICLIFIRRD